MNTAFRVLTQALGRAPQAENEALDYRAIIHSKSLKEYHIVKKEIEGFGTHVPKSKVSMAGSLTDLDFVLVFKGPKADWKSLMKLMSSSFSLFEACDTDGKFEQARTKCVHNYYSRMGL